MPENNSNDDKFKFKKGPVNKIINEKNKLKNNGINIKLNGIRTLKLSSKVNELLIQ